MAKERCRGPALECAGPFFPGKGIFPEKRREQRSFLYSNGMS